MKKCLLAVLFCVGFLGWNAFGQSATTPFITLNLPASQTVYFGNTTTFHVNATGGTPLTYQWYLDGYPAPSQFISSNTLVATNYFWMSEGYYTISATVSNSFGATNFQVCDVEVLPETNVPTISITSPTNNQQVSNSEVTVTGTYGDPLSVYDISLWVNGRSAGGGETGASNTWSSTVELYPGSNTISAYDVNEGFIPSKMSAVTIEYVDNFPITVITNYGSVSPDYNGQQLRVGNNYTMTATPDANFKFKSWTGYYMGGPVTATTSPTVTFPMQVGLTMQANFVDLLNPYLKITTPPGPFLITNNPSFYLVGVATDDEQIAFVTYSLNGAPTNAVNTANSWTNWYQSLALAAGTNVISVYATATNGNVTTDTVEVLLLSTNQLKLQINGKGSVSPDYSNALLEAGLNYSMTATPAGGFVFSNWTGGVGSPTMIFTNKPTVSFMMETGLVLQANFMDTLKPYLKITNPIPTLAFVTNPSSYLVEGVATDDEAIASVEYSFNGGPYTPASLSSGLPEAAEPAISPAYYNSVMWNSASLSLKAGTNVVSVYAVATNGNYSVTDTVEIVSISTNRLTVQTSGRGTISPNYSNALLDVGFYYSMTATPASGLIFSNWTGGVGSPSSIFTNKPTVSFMMETGLVLQANFLDTLKPYLKITNPIPALLLVTNTPSYTVSGTATDDEELAYVYYSFNGAPYTSASIDEPPPAIEPAAIPEINQPAVQWSSQALALKAGTNTVSVYALAVNGNYSVTDTVDLVSISTNPLTLQANGKGTISPNYSNALLDVGFYYTMTATPGSGFIFSNWTGGVGSPTTVYTNKPAVTFLMQTGLVMQANFIDTLKPYLAITNATSGMVITNAHFAVMGVATDDEAIASVIYSFNHGGFTNYAGTNGIQWTAPLTLDEGTNTFAVYAVATNGNVTATNQITLLRYPTISTFLIETNNSSVGNLYSPQSQISFDGKSYLVVFQGDPSPTTAAAMGVTVTTNGVVGEPVQLISNLAGNSPPYLDFDGTNYLVAWDHAHQLTGGRFQPSTLEEIEDFFGNSTTVNQFSTVAFGGGFYLDLWSDSGGPTTNTIYADVFNAAESLVYANVLLSSNGLETAAGGISAAYGGTNFLAVWGAATGDTCLTGQFFGTNGSTVGAPFVIYTNSTPAGPMIPHVTFDGGTNFLVLFNTGVSPANSASTYHILGRFVTTAGAVLTNQMTLTSDPGPQLGASADFDGVNYLVTWVQGFNPYAVDTATTTYGRFFDSLGNPTTAEFPLWTTQPGAEIPLWAPIIWDGSQFALVGGMGHMLTPVPAITTTAASFTNNVINGAFISP